MHHGDSEREQSSQNFNSMQILLWKLDATNCLPTLIMVALITDEATDFQQQLEATVL